MNRKEYISARRILRDNGNYALRWFKDDIKADMLKLQTIRRTPDELSERADRVKWCKQNNISFKLKNWVNSKNWSPKQ